MGSTGCTDTGCFQQGDSRTLWAWEVRSAENFSRSWTGSVGSPFWSRRPSCAPRSYGASRCAMSTLPPPGDMPFSSETFDLAVCFGSLHHIPNVTKVVRELGRVVKPGGWIIIREPVVSMGDWRSRGPARSDEAWRGIPRHLLESAVRNAGFSIKSSVFCYMPLTQRIGDLTSRNLYGSRVGALIDRALSISTAWNYRYHAVKPWQKLRPSSVSIVARRR
jgi:Methylase involved in ubiquinone/menaquinone biosynthesis